MKGKEARVTVVKEKLDRLDFLGEIINTNDDEVEEEIWLSSEEFQSVEFTREECIYWVGNRL